MLNMSIYQINHLSRYTPRHLAVSLCSSISLSMYNFIALSVLRLLSTLRTRRFDFLTLIINLLAFSQFIILSSEVLISSFSFFAVLFFSKTCRCHQQANDIRLLGQLRMTGVTKVTSNNVIRLFYEYLWLFHESCWYKVQILWKIWQ